MTERGGTVVSAGGGATEGFVSDEQKRESGELFRQAGGRQYNVELRERMSSPHTFGTLLRKNGSVVGCCRYTRLLRGRR